MKEAGKAGEEMKEAAVKAGVEMKEAAAKAMAVKAMGEERKEAAGKAMAVKAMGEVGKEAAGKAMGVAKEAAGKAMGVAKEEVLGNYIPKSRDYYSHRTVYHPTPQLLVWGGSIIRCIRLHISPERLTPVGNWSRTSHQPRIRKNSDGYRSRLFVRTMA
mgnify:CR=1 FL=1